MKIAQEIHAVVALRAVGADGHLNAVFAKRAIGHSAGDELEIAHGVVGGVNIALGIDSHILLVQMDAVRREYAVFQHAEAFQPLRRRFSVFRQNLVVFISRFGDMRV